MSCLDIFRQVPIAAQHPFDALAEQSQIGTLLDQRVFIERLCDGR